MTEKIINDKVATHLAICKQLNQTYQEKNADYGDSFSETYQKLGIISAVTRISDKTNRLISLAGKPEAERMVKDETLRDTLIDLAGYAVLTLLEMESAEKCECTSQELCEYCDPALVNPFIDDDGLYLFIDKDRLFAGCSDECTFEKSESVKINYCPMCGREMEVEG